jgi:hypothetical protein
MNFLKTFSNSNGHLIMSLVLIIVGTILMLVSTDGTIKGVGVTLVTTSSGYWFVSSVANHPPTPPGGTA